MSLAKVIQKNKTKVESVEMWEAALQHGKINIVCGAI